VHHLGIYGVLWAHAWGLGLYGLRLRRMQNLWWLGA
jgi:hypothetical protein